MPFGDANAIALTPDRKTYVTLDEHFPSATQPFLAFSRLHGEMAHSIGAVKDNFVYVPSVGWQLKPIQSDPGAIQELTAAEDGIYSGGLLACASAYSEINTYRKMSELLGVSYAAGVHSAGSKFWAKRIAAGVSWDTGNLAADLASFPQPFFSEDYCVMDRAVVSTESHDPRDPLYIRFYNPNIGAVGTLLTLCFTGPAGGNGVGVGNGQYAVKVRADGSMTLYERNKITLAWIKRQTFRWNTSNYASSDTSSLLVISSNAIMDAAGKFTGTLIKLAVTNVINGGYSLINLVAGLAAHSVEEELGISPVYHVPQHKEAVTTLSPLRLDVRRDTRVQFQISRATYPASGTLIDDGFTLPFQMAEPAGEDSLLRLSFFCSLPGDSTVTGALCDETGTELPGGVLELSTDHGATIAYPTPNPAPRSYRVKFVGESTSDLRKTPTITRYNVYRDAVFVTPATTTIESPHTESGTALMSNAIESGAGITINQGAKDCSEDSASFTLADFTDSLGILRTKGRIPVKVEVDLDGTRTTIFRGYTQDQSASRMVRRAPEWAGYPDKDAHHYQLQVAGEWTRLSEALAPKTFTWSQDLGILGFAAFKVTDIITTLLKTAYPPSMINIQDLPLRPMSNDDGTLTMQFNDPIQPIVKKLAADYLGAWVIFDYSTGDHGQWRLITSRQAPFTPLARFYRTPVSGASPQLVHPIAAYTNVISESDSRQIPGALIHAGTLTPSFDPPEANVVYVNGLGKRDALEEDSTQNLATALAVNYSSFNALGLAEGDSGYPDPNNPDFLGRYVPIWVYDPTISTREVAEWVAYRYWQTACHGVYKLKFTAAALFITDFDDADQVRPRLLRYYDPVSVEKEDGTFETWLVVGCVLNYSKDHIMTATYDLVRPTNLETINGILPGKRGMEYLRTIRNREVRRYTAQAGEAHVFGGTAIYGWQASNAVRLPDQGGEPMQVIDNTSSDFGKFYFIPGLSIPGGPDVIR